jgi:hypothetical protein
MDGPGHGLLDCSITCLAVVGHFLPWISRTIPVRVEPFWGILQIAGIAYLEAQRPVQDDSKMIIRN